MALTKGTNSFVDVAEADAYFGDRLDGADWSALDNTTKANALVTATKILDEMSWIGTAVNENQNLSFPRVAEYFDPKVGAFVYLDGTGTPTRVLNATFDLGLHLALNPDVLKADGSVTELRMSTIQLTNIRNTPKIPPGVLAEIRCLLVNNSSSWWRAN